jgi:anti-anti-sigma factor
MQWDLVDGVAVIELLTKEIDKPHLAQELGGQLSALLQAGPSKRFLLNCHRVKYMSSTAFGILVEFWKKASAGGTQVRICAMDPHVRVGADIISLGRFIPIHDDEEAALAAFGTEGSSA